MFKHHRAIPLITIRQVAPTLIALLLLITPRITRGQIITLSFTPTVALDANGHLEAFALGSDGGLWRIVQIAPNLWGGWQGIGGLVLVGPPVAAVNQNRQLEIFVKGSNGALWHNPQLSSGNFSGWSQLSLTSTPSGGGLGSVPVVGANADGHLEVFALGSDAALNHIWQLAPNGTTGWSSWASFGGTAKSIPTVALNPLKTSGKLMGSLEVFVVGNDFPTPHLYTLWEVAPNSSPTWSAWTSLGGWILPQPSVAANMDGHLEVFAIGNDLFSGQNVTHNWQSSPGATSWVGFSSLGSPPPGVISPTAGVNQDSRLEIFGISGDKALWHRWQMTPGGSWAAGWASLGVPGTGTNSLIAVAANADGRLDVFAISTDGILWEIHQTVPNGGWSAWTSLGQPGKPAGGGNIALLTFLALLALWIAFRIRGSKRIVFR